MAAILVSLSIASTLAVMLLGAKKILMSHAIDHVARAVTLTAGLAVFPPFMLLRPENVLRNQLPQEPRMISSTRARWRQMRSFLVSIGRF